MKRFLAVSVLAAGLVLAATPAMAQSESNFIEDFTRDLTGNLLKNTVDNSRPDEAKEQQVQVDKPIHEDGRPTIEIEGGGVKPVNPERPTTR